MPIKWFPLGYLSPLDITIFLAPLPQKFQSTGHVWVCEMLFFSEFVYLFTLQYDLPSPVSSQSYPYKFYPLPSPQRRGKAPCYCSILGHPVRIGLSTSSPTETQPGSPVRGGESKGKQQCQRQPLFQLLGD